MTTKFNIPSSDPTLLSKARRVANEFVAPYMTNEVAGIVFLGAIVRGYFDHSADIDIAIIKEPSSGLTIHDKFFKVEGMEVQVWFSDYESERTQPWDMPKRWTYSQSRIHYDPSGRIAQLLEEKVPLLPEERKWLMMSGLTLSKWYVEGLTNLWVERGNITSAHHMIDQGVNYFFDMLSGFNHELVADMKWRYYCVEQMEKLPRNFRKHIQDSMRLQSFSMDELDRRKKAFMEMWGEMKPIIEQEVQLTYQEMEDLV
jgi:hypothetical protein